MKQLAMLVVVETMAAVGFGSIVGCNSDTSAESTAEQIAPATTEPVKPENTGSGMVAIETAAQANKYLFALFLKEENDQTAAMRKVLGTVMETVADRTDSIEVNVTDPLEKTIVDKFDLARAPMPLILAVAPNRAHRPNWPFRGSLRVHLYWSPLHTWRQACRGEREIR
jgi:hypothetical protein